MTCWCNTLTVVLFGLISCGKAQVSVPANIEVRHDVPYADTKNSRQTLDLFLPKTKSEQPLPLIISIHGGGWSSGDKTDAFVGILHLLLQEGKFAGASINYRLTNETRWPEQIYDCKAAIRWLRAHAKELNIDPQKFGVIGGSAGSHLACLLGTSGDVAELEGNLGADLTTSSRVQCVVNICGPINFLTIGQYPSDISWNEAKSIGGKLLGGAIPALQEVARQASPITYITTDDPPFLSAHGTRDTIVPFEQATEFNQALKKAGVPQVLIIGKDGEHAFFHKDVMTRERLFLEKWLLARDHLIAMKDATITIPPKK
ncbi:Acetyl esterase/lipase [Prosthecobacter debontii]|uniref:Acetyl esterase/lipase n=1 Tax=Prosthecobacter debontii TaxID=48467 RepID=A0A1T4YVI9_9BACT|nr:Acetyl esterase/lipase [Prosthecobacter debontii]